MLGLKWELRGKEHLEKDQACIIVANHQSSLDILGKKLRHISIIIHYKLFIDVNSPCDNYIGD